jgi:hypothetical protein
VATGLINATSSATVELNSVLNLARVASSSDGTQSAAALVYSSSGQPASFSSSQAYRWRGLSASVTAYHSFVDGEISVNNGGWIYNGTAVNCSNFSDLNFWNNSASMNLSTASGWNFSQISSGYLPTMNGKFADQPFTCMNEVIFPGISDITNVRFGFGERPLPVVGDSTISVHFFSPSAPDNPATYDIAYRFETSGSFYFDVFYDGNLVYCSLSSLDDWPLPEGGLMQGATISLRAAADPCVVPNFQFTLAKEEIQFLLKWTTEDTESLAVIYSNFGNLAGGVPPGVTATNLGYLETAIDHNLKLGLSTKGTYTITATGSFLGQGDTKSRPVARTQTWPNYLLVITQIGNIYFPDVFTSGNPSTTTYKTIIYKNNDNISVSQVRSVNESRYAAIRWLASVAVTEGSQSTSAGETTYRAQDPVNRGAMAQFLQKLSGFTDAQIKLIYQGHENQFADIASLYQSNPGRYYSILWLADTGITVGCNTEGTLFCPGNVVNRGAMAEFMRKFAGVAVTEAKTSPFPDVNLTAKDLKYDNSSDSVTVPKVSEVRMGAINWLASTEITLGSGSIGGVTAYRAQDAVNRGAMAEFMYKLALHVGSTPA